MEVSKHIYTWRQKKVTRRHLQNKCFFNARRNWRRERSGQVVRTLFNSIGLWYGFSSQVD